MTTSDYLKSSPTSNFFLLAGPCVIENEEMALDIARTIAPVCAELGIPYVFKGSYRNAYFVAYAGEDFQRLHVADALERIGTRAVGFPVGAFEHVGDAEFCTRPTCSKRRQQQDAW
mgnify:CR=1 FL=1